MNTIPTNIRDSGDRSPVHTPNTGDSSEAQKVIQYSDDLPGSPVMTSDGSHTLYSPAFKQHYHSTFGAIAESEHIFIRSGLHYFFHDTKRPPSAGTIRILEAGFGTGLNAFLTQRFSGLHQVNIHYTALEAFPLNSLTTSLLNYPSLTGGAEDMKLFHHIHQCNWGDDIRISDFFTLCKMKIRFEDYIPPGVIHDIVYFDAFDPGAQPELWKAAVLGKIAQSIASGGLLVTYSVRGDVVRLLRSAGFHVEKLAGPPGKRHILRAMAKRHVKN